MRPSKLTDTVIADVKKLLFLGVPHNKIGDYLGLSNRTFYNWMSQGEALRDKVLAGELKRPKAEEKRLIQLFHTVKRGDAEFVRNNLVKMAAASNDGKNWQAIAWMLERRFPKEFGRKDSLAVGGDPKNPLNIKHQNKVDTSNFSTDELEVWEVLMKKAAAPNSKDEEDLHNREEQPSIVQTDMIRKGVVWDAPVPTPKVAALEGALDPVTPENHTTRSVDVLITGAAVVPEKTPLLTKKELNEMSGPEIIAYWKKQKDES